MSSSVSRKITADGRSPLTQYVNLLVAIPEALDRRIQRDAEAMRILEARALPEAVSREERRYWDRWRAEQSSELIKTPRIWTRRDKRLCQLRRGIEGGSYPARRTSRLIAWLAPPSGASLHDQWFRLALQEARDAGESAVLLPKLEAAKQAWGRMMDAARAISQDDEADFQTPRFEVGGIACELMDYTKPPAEGKASDHSDEVAETADETCIFNERDFLFDFRNRLASELSLARFPFVNDKPQYAELEKFGEHCLEVCDDTIALLLLGCNSDGSTDDAQSLLQNLVEGSNDWFAAVDDTSFFLDATRKVHGLDGIDFCRGIMLSSWVDALALLVETLFRYLASDGDDERDDGSRLYEFDYARIAGDHTLKLRLLAAFNEWTTGEEFSADRWRERMVAAAETESATDTSSSTASSTRYVIDHDAMLVRIDGKALTVSPEGARMAQLLLDSGGEWVSMRDHDFSKPSNVKNKLPSEIRDLIETAKGKGYRLQRRITGA